MLQPPPGLLTPKATLLIIIIIIIIRGTESEVAAQLLPSWGPEKMPKRKLSILSTNTWGDRFYPPRQMGYQHFPAPVAPANSSILACTMVGTFSNILAPWRGLGSGIALGPPPWRKDSKWREPLHGAHMPQGPTASASILRLESNIAKCSLEITELRHQVAIRDEVWPPRANGVRLCCCCMAHRAATPPCLVCFRTICRQARHCDPRMSCRLGGPQGFRAGDKIGSGPNVAT